MSGILGGLTRPFVPLMGADMCGYGVGVCGGVCVVVGSWGPCRMSR